MRKNLANFIICFKRPLFGCFWGCRISSFSSKGVFLISPNGAASFLPQIWLPGNQLGLMNCRGCQPTRVQPKIDLQRNWTKPEPSSLPSFLLGGSFWSSSLRFLECNYAAIGPVVLCFSGHSRKPKQGQRSIPLTFIWLPISHLPNLKSEPKQF